MNLSVAFKADGDCILVSARPLVGLLGYVIDLHLYTAEPVADTATAMAGHQELLNIFILEFSHRPSPVNLLRVQALRNHATAAIDQR